MMQKQWVSIALALVGLLALFSMPAIAQAFDEPFPMDFQWEADGLTVRFSYVGENVTSYRWAFGDGQASKRADPVHTYADYGETGEYNVSLEVQDQYGEFHKITKPIVLAKPVIDLEDNELHIIPIPWPAYMMIATGSVSVIFNLYREGKTSSAVWQEVHITVACFSGLWAFLGVILYVL